MGECRANLAGAAFNFQSFSLFHKHLVLSLNPMVEFYVIILRLKSTAGLFDTFWFCAVFIPVVYDFAMWSQ